MSQDSDDEYQIVYNDFVNDICEYCHHELNSNTHYEMCDMDTKTLNNARIWIQYMDYQDSVIDEYHKMCDEGYILPKDWVITQLKKFVPK